MRWVHPLQNELWNAKISAIRSANNGSGHTSQQGSGHEQGKQQNTVACAQGGSEHRSLGTHCAICMSAWCGIPSCCLHLQGRHRPKPSPGKPCPKVDSRSEPSPERERNGPETGRAPQVVQEELQLSGAEHRAAAAANVDAAATAETDAAAAETDAAAAETDAAVAETDAAAVVAEVEGAEAEVAAAAKAEAEAANGFV